ncbi:Na+/H+ antiporter NhaC family protein [Oceanirhabdus sp. W0125-5]|uniref:Na+/H+ antiporter NhaC family protein n=1 Tax=Oceanirhabdus sp. W0125-5 TaxID=2999116 RepID=UPI0022F2E512|nr:Na+/H+ antiporter NhaC family protein [Oceanirhabdus sp. W0125-5]WBW95719.1 Na+/H+ antiporter NhaC family protein [Oceanirhabdus sp. W0125-5]
MFNKLSDKNFNILLLLVNILILATFIISGISLSIAFCILVLLTSLILLASHKCDLRALFILISKCLKESLWICIIIFFIGASISAWMISGVVPSIMYYGFMILDKAPVNFILLCFIITAIISYFMGTAIGTISSMGIALLGIAKGINAPIALTLGSIISGAFIADKISPISGLLNLTLNSAGTSYKKYFKTSLYTLIPTVILTSILYFILGSIFCPKIDTSNILLYMIDLNENFIISPYLLFIPFAVVFLTFLGLKTLYTLPIGTLLGSICAIVVQKKSLYAITNAILKGYSLKKTTSIISPLIKGGGAFNMLEVIIIVAGSIVLVTILDENGVLSPLTELFLKNITSPLKLIINTSLLSSVMTIITCDQTMGIVLPGKLMKQHYLDYKLTEDTLARTISDTGTIIAPLMPWNVNSIIILAITGVSSIVYAPFTFLCILNPLISIIVIWVKLRQTPFKINKELKITSSD